MAILKQNGANGKIIRSQITGKSLKQNYLQNFYFLGENQYQHVNVPFFYNKAIPSEFSILLRFANNSSDYVTAYLVSDFFRLDTNTQSSPATTVNVNNPNSTLAYSNMSSFHGIGNLAVCCVKDNLITRRGINRSIGNYNNSYTPTNFGNLILGAGGSRGAGLSFKGSITEFLYYSREISEDEISYIFNNGLGDAPRNENSLDIRYIFKSAKILDFSDANDGSDMRVGFENIGNLNGQHSEITDLPAGTLQEQLDYANSNLFYLW